MGEITHIGLAVPDLDQAIDWYSKVFGFYTLAGPFEFEAVEADEENMTQDLQGTEVQKMRNAHLMSHNGIGIELFEFQQPAFNDENPPLHKGFFHICLIVDNLVESIERIVQHGGKQRSKIWQTTKGKPHFLVYTEDPFGNIIELYTRNTSEMYANK
ncbi:VOC family protein [Planococcus sp. 107-1]|uniref:VOC family protein n=1 Tax=Planococcus sp. 107-1 TaxID=2908840 RepID=UPI001F2F3C50|nr:VOC family protein [Planococcus sp. 107-1]UJF26577.1 VOC family protein [Planococcus sp. 107-1]